MIRRSLCLSLLIVLWAIAPSALAAGKAKKTEKVNTYSNKEFGFSFQYPATWTVSPSSAPNLRVRVVAPDKAPPAECSVIVKQYPNAANAKQSDIDQIFSEQPTVQELEDILNQGGSEIKVTQASAGALHVRPAHVARFRYTSGTTHLSGEVLMTATPGLTWSLTCSGRGDNAAAAEKNFQSWQKRISALIASFRFH